MPPATEEPSPDIVEMRGGNGATSNDGYADQADARPGHRASGGPLHSTMADDSKGIEVGYLNADHRAGLPAGELLATLADPEIDEDTEAAEALRANANVKVRKVGKMARSMNVQSVRKMAKRLTLRGTNGNKRGKPPRVPPGLGASPNVDTDVINYVVEEGKEEESGPISQSFSEDSSDKHPSKQGATSTGDGTQSHEGLPSHEVGRPVKDDTAEGGYKTTKENRHSSINEDAKDIPMEVVAATMDAGRTLMGALDPHNMLQAQRWKRKNKKGGKRKRKSYVKGKVIDGRHELYTLSIAVMLGVRTSIARTNTIIASSDGKKLLTPQDFMAEEKYEFAPKGSAITPPHKLSHTFKFKDYAPVAFAYLRRMFGVNEFDFLLSVCGNANFIEFISNAKSGQFFFYSNDGKYMIKTMTNAESKFLRRSKFSLFDVVGIPLWLTSVFSVLPHYFKHCSQNPNTMIIRFLGMYRVKLYHLRRNVKFVIMNSVYYTDKSLQSFYDLKGSEIGREAKPGQSVLKDNDLRKVLPQEAFSFPPDVRERVRDQLVSDCRFLRRMQIMDYSMLVGIHHIPPKQSRHVTEGGLRIKERASFSRHSRQGSHGSDQMAAASQVAHDDSGSHSDVSATSFSGNHHDDRLHGSHPHHDLNRRLMREMTPTNLEFAGLLEDDDDFSYLEGSEPHKVHMKEKKKKNFQKGIYDDVEVKKEETAEQVFWPFHRFYDINGFRRMKPKPCFRCSTNPCVCDGHRELIKAWRIPDFTPPLSNRKDGGFVMDTAGLPMPMKLHSPQGDRLYEGKIFYMGIIDILQQYNARKRVETTYRKLENTGQEPSCVSPHDYAERFIRFFDEYAQTAKVVNSNSDEKTEVEASIAASSPKEEPNSRVDIKVSNSSDREGYSREPVIKLDKDGKPVIPKGRVIVT